MRDLLLATLTALVVFSFSVRAEAVNWVAIGSAEGVSLSVDTESLTYAPDGAKEAWFMFSYNPPDCSSNYAKKMNRCVSSYAFLEWHYIDKTYCMYGFVNYFTDGTNTGFSTTPCEKRQVTPGTASEKKWKYLYR